MKKYLPLLLIAALFASCQKVSYIPPPGDETARPIKPDANNNCPAGYHYYLHRTWGRICVAD